MLYRNSVRIREDMKHAIVIAGLCAAAFLGGLSCAQRQPDTAALESLRTQVADANKRADDAESRANQPADTTELDSLRTRLQASEAESAANLKGWQAAQARYEWFETNWQPRQPKHAQPGSSELPGGQGSPRAFIRWRTSR